MCQSVLGFVYMATSALLCRVPRALREAQDIFGLDFDPVELDRMMDSYLSSDEEEEGAEEVRSGLVWWCAVEWSKQKMVLYLRSRWIVGGCLQVCVWVHLRM